MKIFTIRDETDNSQKDLAYLLYYETEKRFYIELPEDADPWETPLLLSTFAQKGEHTINSYCGDPLVAGKLGNRIGPRHAHRSIEFVRVKIRKVKSNWIVSKISVYQHKRRAGDSPEHEAESLSLNRSETLLCFG